MPQAKLDYRGYLLHLTHYDPVWWERKAKEVPFDPKVARDVLSALQDNGFNMLIIGVSDGVRFKSHPELRRHYSHPMSVLKRLADDARKRGMQIVPKLNFSRSEINHHNEWMRKKGQQWHEQFEDDVFFKLGFDAIDEVIAACAPEKFFHIGMDEDHDRSHQQYVDAIVRLHDGLKKRKLRTVTWSDSALDYASGQVYREKSERAERDCPRDVVRLLWNYWMVPEKEMRTIRRRGFELWGAPGARTPELLNRFKEALLKAGGNGMVMTHWAPCIADRREDLLKRINEYGPLYR